MSEDNPQDGLVPLDATYGSLTAQVGDTVLRRPLSVRFLAVLAFVSGGTVLLVVSITYLIITGVGIWGINVPVAWGFAIANFVWWIGIGHAGTFISAILLLMRQQWRASINRFAEAMTLFAVACAGLFPLLHLGRPWVFYWMFPYPDTMNLWPQFRSPLIWDLFAVITYFTVSLLFWFLGMVPDLAALRDRADKRWKQVCFGFLALGWRGSAKHWQRYQMAYLILAGLATPLVISVHSVVGLDFAVTQVPGWHLTMFPPYFVAGAIFSGFSMVIMLAIPIRRIYGLKNLITDRHLDNMAKLMLVTGLIVAYSYVIEHFLGWYSGNEYEMRHIEKRAFGAYGFIFWTTIVCNVAVTQLLWFKKMRTNVWWLFGISFFIQIGMWVERVMIVVTSLHAEYMPSMWSMYYPTFWDWATLLGTIGLFFTLFVLFVRTLPMVPMHEVRELLHKRKRS